VVVQVLRRTVRRPTRDSFRRGRVRRRPRRHPHGMADRVYIAAHVHFAPTLSPPPSERFVTADVNSFTPPGSPGRRRWRIGGRRSTGNWPRAPRRGRRPCKLEGRTPVAVWGWADGAVGQATDGRRTAAGFTSRERSALGRSGRAARRDACGQGGIRPARIATTRDGRLQEVHGLRTSADISSPVESPTVAHALRAGDECIGRRIGLAADLRLRSGQERDGANPAGRCRTRSPGVLGQTRHAVNGGGARQHLGRVGRVRLEGRDEHGFTTPRAAEATAGQADGSSQAGVAGGAVEPDDGAGVVFGHRVAGVVGGSTT